MWALQNELDKMTYFHELVELIQPMLSSVSYGAHYSYTCNKQDSAGQKNTSHHSLPSPSTHTIYTYKHVENSYKE